MTVSISTLFATATISQLYQDGLALMRILGLAVTSWRTGDPTLATLQFLCEVLAQRDLVDEQFIRAGFLSTATDDWKTLVAQEMYGVERIAASYATSTVTLANSGGGYYTIEPGDVTVKSSTSDITYHNTNSTVLASGPGTTCTIDVVCDTAGSDGSAGVNEIDALVTSLLGVTVTASTAAVGVDQQSNAELQVQCDESLGALSPSGPPDAYRYVVCNSSLTGRTDITRAATVDESSTGAVTVYVAGPSGSVAGAAVTAAQSAVDLWAAPLTITATVSNSTNQAVDVTAVVYGDNMPVDFADLAENAIGVLLAAADIGGTITLEMLRATVYNALVAAGASNVGLTWTTPSADVVLAAGYVPIAGAINITEAP